MVGQDDPAAVETKKSRSVGSITTAAVLLGMTTLGYMWWQKYAPLEPPAPIVVIPNNMELQTGQAGTSGRSGGRA